METIAASTLVWAASVYNNDKFKGQGAITQYTAVHMYCDKVFSCRSHTLTSQYGNSENKDV